MRYKPKLDNKERMQELIRLYKGGHKEAEEKLIYEIIPLIKTYVSKFYKGRSSRQDNEEIETDLMIKIFEKIKEQKIINDPVAWIKTIIERHCIDQYRKERSQKGKEKSKIKGINPIIDEKENITLIEVMPDSKAISPGSRKYYEQIEKVRIPPKIEKCLEMTLDYIEEIYRRREQIRTARNKNQKAYRILKDLYVLKDKIEYNTGRFIKEKASRYEYFKQIGAFGSFFPREFIVNPGPEFDRNKLSDSAARELEEFEGLGFERTLPFEAYNGIKKLIEYAEIAIFFKHFPPEKFMSLIKPLSLSHEDMIKNIPDMRIEPPRLLMEVLTKALKKGKKSNRKLIKRIFIYLKRKTKGTKQEFLFESLKEDLSNFETIRTSRYKDPVNRKFYDKLIESIYQKSFIDQTYTS